MPIEFTAIHCGNGHFETATAHDAELAGSYKTGQPVKLTATKQSARSLQHHKLYWGGLVALCLDYWEPDNGLVTATEARTLEQFAVWLGQHGADQEVFKGAAKEFLGQLGQRRAQRYESPEKTAQGCHEWIKEQAGYFDLEASPGGIRKRTKSINFNAMSQEEFNRFYKRAFSVVWRVVLSQHFQSEVECQKVIDKLVSMG